MHLFETDQLGYDMLLEMGGWIRISGIRLHDEVAVACVDNPRLTFVIYRVANVGPDHTAYLTR